MDITTLVGKRVLLKLLRSPNSYYGSVGEYKIIEISPSGNWTKLMSIYGNKFWRPTIEINFVEELKQLEKCPKKERL